MNNPFVKLAMEEEPSMEESKDNQLEDLKKRLEDLEIWQNDWTPEDRELAENLESQIDQLKNELGKSELDEE